jgi:hypothetical protein
LGGRVASKAKKLEDINDTIGKQEIKKKNKTEIRIFSNEGNNRIHCQ